ncbi:MAG: hypothetical protein AAF943_03275 [Pseudomonadota bacterium]
MRLLYTLIVLIWSAWPAMAQQDAMALQRCIWSCLSNSPGAHSYQYEQCVARHCAPQAAPIQSAWWSGIASDGVHRFAMTQAEQGIAFTYFCVPGQSYFVLADVAVPPAQYRFLIGAIDYVITLDTTRGPLSVSIPHDHRFMQAVRRGGEWLSISTMQGQPVIRFSLRGADQHIGQAVSGCLG